MPIKWTFIPNANIKHLSGETSLVESALMARRHGISIVPVMLPSKKPLKGLSWKQRQRTLPDEKTIRRELAGGNGNLGFAVVGGKGSGNLEAIDVDLSGEFYTPWVNLVEAEAPGLINRLAIQKTMNGGFHVISRCRQAIPVNTKLARKRIEVSGPGEHEYQGKKYKSQRQGDKWFIYPVAIETRGQGGYAVVSPSPGYSVIQPGERGEFFDFPEITAAEREILIRCAKALDEYPPEPVRTTEQQAGGRPGEDFNARGNILELLLGHGWKEAGQTRNRLHLTRPGKDRGISATLYDGKVLHVFSSNALPFEADKSYSRFGIYALLEHSGDFRAAAKTLAAQGYGDNREQPEATSTEKPTSRLRFEFIHNSEILANLKPIEWQIQDILVEKSLYYDFGDPGSFKTFVALDRLLCIAAGLDYHGHPVKQGPVFYIAGEGQQGIGRRIAAWHIRHKTKTADVPFFLAKTPTQLMDPGAVDEVRQSVDDLAKKYGSPAVLHIDTLARNFGTGDENATKDMNQVIQNLDAAFGNDFCRGITHHTGHFNKDRARGSIVLHGAADEAFRASFACQQVLIECKKMKDAPSSPAMLFDLNTILLLIGNQEDKSFTLSLSAEGDEAAAATGFSNTCKVSGNMSKALDLLEGMYAKCEKNLADRGRVDAIPRVEVKNWRKACLDKKLYRRRSTFTRALESMVERGLVFLDETKVHVCTVSICLKCKEIGVDF